MQFDQNFCPVSVRAAVPIGSLGVGGAWTTLIGHTTTIVVVVCICVTVIVRRGQGCGTRSNTRCTPVWLVRLIAMAIAPVVCAVPVILLPICAPMRPAINARNTHWG